MDALDKMKQETELLCRFLELADVREFIYDIEADELENFRYGKERKVFFKGTLDEWAEDYKKRVSEAGTEQFREFYRAVKNGEESFGHQYEYKGLYRIVKGVTIRDEDGRRRVYGVILMGQFQKQKEVPFQRASDKDPVLNLLNKKAILEYAQRKCEMKDGTVTYLVILDLDHFKMINDSFGHLFGDEVLVTVTDIVNKVVGDHGMVGRIGGDELLIVTKDVNDKAELRPILREIRMTVEETYRGKMHDMELTCSMGAVAYPTHVGSFKEGMDLADKMLYLAKEKGRNRYLIYTPELHENLVPSIGSGETRVAQTFPLAFDKIGIVQFMMEDYLRKGTSSNEAAFQNVGKAFGLSEILIVYEQGRNGFRWTPEETAHGEEDLKFIPLTERFYANFDANHIYVLDGLYALKEDQKELKDKLEARGVESALFYKLSNGSINEGYVMYAKKVLRQKWSEYELLALSTIAKIFEMSIYH